MPPTGPIAGAAETRRTQRLNAYREDPGQVMSDVRSAQRTVHDYAGRWVLELLQNAEDAGASNVRINVVPGDAVYVFDNSPQGFQATSVESLSTLDRSDKKEGIGRKGLGFKAVYEVTETPQVAVSPQRNGQWTDGVEFGDARCQALLSDANLSPAVRAMMTNEGLPFHFLPWPLESDNIEWPTSSGFGTCVRLPFRNPAAQAAAVKAIDAWDDDCLLAFHHLREVVVTGPSPRSSSLVFEGDRATFDRSGVQSIWQTQRRCVGDIPPEIAASLKEEDLARAQRSEVMVAAPVDEKGRLGPLDGTPLLNVYYPTEHPAPVALFLHADFAVKSDREHLVPFAVHPYNRWLGALLAAEVIRFVNSASDADRYSLCKALRAPTTSDHQTIFLWTEIKSGARSSDGLHIDTNDGRRPLAECVLFQPRVRPRTATFLVETAAWWPKVVLADLAADNKLRLALTDLGVGTLDDGAVLEHLEASVAGRDEEYRWRAWHWATAIHAATESPDRLLPEERIPGGQHAAFTAYKTRLESLPLISIGGEPMSRREIRTRGWTIWIGESGLKIPPWLPIRVPDEAWRARFQATDKESVERAAAKKWGLTDDKTLVPALSKAFEAFWTDRQSIPQPESALRFVVELSETTKLEDADFGKLNRLPMKQKGASQWAPAEVMHLGAEFGQPLMDVIYDGNDALFAELPSDLDLARLDPVLDRLGCHRRPPVEKFNPTWTPGEHASLVPLANQYAHLRSPNVTDWRWKDLEMERLDTASARALLVLLAKEWVHYQPKSILQATYAKQRASPQTYNDPSPNNAQWLVRLRSRLVPPQKAWLGARQKLEKCWLPDGENGRHLGVFAPVLDAEIFGPDWEVVSQFLFRVSAIPGADGPATLARELQDALSRGFTEWERQGLQSGNYDDAMTLVRHLLDVVDRAKIPLKGLRLCLRTGAGIQLESSLNCSVTRSAEYVASFIGRANFVRLRQEHARLAVEFLGVQDFDSLATEAATYDGLDPSETERAQSMLAEITPYWAIALASADHRLSLRTAHQRVAGLVVEVVHGLSVQVSTTKYGSATIRKPHLVEGNKILVLSGGRLEARLSEAAADFMQRRGEHFGDYLHNLVGATRERRIEMLSRDEPRSEVEAGLAAMKEAPTLLKLRLATGGEDATAEPDAVVAPTGPASDEAAAGSNEPGSEPSPGTSSGRRTVARLLAAERAHPNELDLGVPVEEIQVNEPINAAPAAPHKPRVQAQARPVVDETGPNWSGPITRRDEVQMEISGAKGEELVARYMRRKGWNFEWLNEEYETKRSPDFIVYEGERKRLIEVKTVSPGNNVVYLSGPQWVLAREHPDQFELWVAILHDKGTQMTPVIYENVAQRVWDSAIRIHGLELKVQRVD